MTAEEYFGDWMKVIDKEELYRIMHWLKTVESSCLCPSISNIFRIFKICPLNSVTTIFVGQDVYPQPGVATGIPFGNKEGTKLSPSLEILKEACIDYTIPHGIIEFDQTLESWVNQGVFMINAALTCGVNRIGSHINVWRPFVSKLITNISQYDNGFVWVLFGSVAQSFEPFIKGVHKVIKVPHPSYFARQGISMPSNVFKEVNDYLKNQYNKEIEFYKEL